MKSIIRSIGAFIYTSIIALGFLLLSSYILTRAVIFSDGFWQTLCAVVVILFLLGWISEKGVQLLSIPYNWLWDTTKITRYSTIIPLIPVGLWCISVPFRMPLKFGVGDWIITIVWLACVVFFFLNMILLPFNNLNMGRK